MQDDSLAHLEPLNRKQRFYLLNAQKKEVYLRYTRDTDEEQAKLPKGWVKLLAPPTPKSKLRKLTPWYLPPDGGPPQKPKPPSTPEQVN